MERLEGRDAIEYAEAHDDAILRKCADPTEEARTITPDEAREIIREDPALVYVMEATDVTKIIDDRSYAQTEVLTRLRALAYWRAAERIEVEASEPGAADWRIILTAPGGAGEWRTLDEIGEREIDVRWYGGELLEDCPLIATLNPERGGIA